MKSVIDVSKIANVSKQAVFQYIKANNVETTKVKNTSYIVNESDVTEIIRHFTLDKGLDESFENRSMLKEILEKDEAVSNQSMKFMKHNKDDNSNASSNKLLEKNKELLSEIDKLTTVHELLNKQIDELKADKEYLKKDKDDLIRLLDQQQVLMLESNKKMKRLESTIDDLQQSKDQEEDNATQQNKEADKVNNSASNVSFVRSVFKMLRR